LFPEPDGLLDGDLVERVHAHLDVGELDPAAVGLDPRAHVVIDDPLDGHEDFHGHPPVFERVRNIVTLAIALLASLVNPPAVTSQTSHHVPLKSLSTTARRSVSFSRRRGFHGCRSW